MDKDSGTIAALMIRFREQRLPRAKRMLERVNRGERLSDTDIQYLQRVFDDANTTRSLIERNPEYHDLVSRFIGMYHEIVEKALENEKAGKD